MMIPCNYYINVAKEITYPHKPRYVHYCKIELGDCMKETATEKYNEIITLFTKEKGFKCSLNYVCCSGEILAED